MGEYGRRAPKNVLLTAQKTAANVQKHPFVTRRDAPVPPSRYRNPQNGGNYQSKDETDFI